MAIDRRYRSVRLLNNGLIDHAAIDNGRAALPLANDKPCAGASG
jgi:hypothetical protein